MKILLAEVSFVFALFLFAGCPTKTDTNIYQKWVNSYEEETDKSLQCFRSSDYDFPENRRFRTTFTLNEDGTFSYAYLGPTDMRVTKSGTWVKVNDMSYAMTFDDPSPNFKKTFTVDVVSLEDGILKIKRPDMADNSPKKSKDMTDLIIKKWWNSYEDETQAATEKVYRPDSFKFPRSRGRIGFEFKANGEFDYNYPGPTDARMTDSGQWLRLSDKRIKVMFNESRPGRVDEFTISIISIDENILKIEPLQLATPRN